MFRTLVLLLLLLPARSWAQADTSQAPPPVRHSGNTFSIDDTLRPHNQPPDTNWAAREIDLLTNRLQLDSSQAGTVAAVIRQRQQQLRQLREAPISDRDIRKLRLQKILDDADRDIEKVLDEKQRKVYDTIIAERQQRMKERDEQEPGPGQHHRHGGNRGFPGSGGSRQ